ncbi:putative multidrug resistance protein NorM [Sphingomonas antarctica]|uniref:MATE family efflux transporter n=1 Tax=Sphingomonas antarctica TaxID=2040274 RepID=UPI0039EB786D
MADSELSEELAAPPPLRHGQRDLTVGPIAMTLIAFALPTLGANVLQSLNGSINAIWIGNFLGEAALAATSNANIVMFLTFAAVFGLAMASTILIGQAMGRRDLDAAKRTLGTSFGMVALIGVVTAIIGYLAVPALLRALATPAAAYPLAVAYTRVIFLGLPFIFLNVLLSSAMRGVGDAMTPLKAMILNVAIDAGLNPFLIRGWGPFPEMGIAGSATASLVASVVTTGVLIAYLYRKRLPLALRGAEMHYLRPDWPLVRIIVGKGLPMGFQMVVLSLGMLLMIGLVNRQGVDTTAAYGAIGQLWGYIQMPALAISAGVSAMAAQNIGAGKWDRVERTAWAGSAINLGMTGTLVLLIYLTDRPLLGLFLTASSPAVPIAVHIHNLASWSFLLFGVSMVLGAAMRANGAVAVPLVILIFAMFPGRLGFAYGLLPSLGADALWWAFPFGSAISLVLTTLYFQYGGWRRLKMQEKAA